MMKLELKNKWVTALRSGRYRQTQAGCLKDGDGYCCLGVLCRVDGIRSKSRLLMDGAVLEHIAPGYRDRVGITARQERRLIQMNDGAPNSKTFPEIADWIEKNIQAK